MQNTMVDTDQKDSSENDETRIKNTCTMANTDQKENMPVTRRQELPPFITFDTSQMDSCTNEETRKVSNVGITMSDTMADTGLEDGGETREKSSRSLCQASWSTQAIRTVTPVTGRRTRFWTVFKTEEMLRRIRASAEEKRRKGTEAGTSTTQKDVEEIRKKSRHNLFEKEEPGTVPKGYRQSECCSDSSFRQTLRQLRPQR